MKYGKVVGAVAVLVGALTPHARALAFPESATPIGVTATRLNHAFNRLIAPPLDDPAFVLADVQFGMNRRFTEYSGDISGRLLGALSRAGRVLNRPAPLVDILVKELPLAQQPDGHFGAPQDLGATINQERDMPILWGNGRLLRALAEFVRHSGDNTLRDTAIRLGEYVCATRPYYGRTDNFEAVGGTFASGFTTCYPSLIDGLVQLGIAADAPRFFEEARFIADLALMDDDFEKRHSHGRLTAFRGMVELDLATNARAFVPEIERRVAHIAANYTFPTSGIPEIFDRSYDRDEGCSEADWVWVHLLLWQATGNPAYLDTAERVVRNHIYATLCNNGGAGHFTFTSLAHDGRDYRGGGIARAASDSYWCCSMHVTQLLADLPSWGAVVDETTLRITWLAEIEATVLINDVRVAIAVEEEEPCQWSIRLRPAKPVAFDVALRVPGWAKTIRVDGEEVAGTEGWFRRARSGDDETTLSVTLPAALRAEPIGSADAAVVALYSGPNMLYLPDIGVRDAFAQPGQVPSVVVSADRMVDAHLPALLAGPRRDHQQVLLSPMAMRMESGCRLLFNVEAVSADEFDAQWLTAVPIPDLGVPLRIQAAYDGPYALYLDGAKIFDHSGYEESPLVEVNAVGGEHFFAIVAAVGPGASGVIGAVKHGDGRLVTQPLGWRAYVFDRKPSPDELTAPVLGARDATAIRDLGAFGTPPWKHVPAHFAGTGARWIWIDPETTLPEEAWVVVAIPFAVEDES